MVRILTLFVVILSLTVFTLAIKQKRIIDIARKRMDMAFAKLVSRYKLVPQGHYFTAYGPFHLLNRFLVCEASGFVWLDKKSGIIERISYESVAGIIIPDNVLTSPALLRKRDGGTIQIKLSQDLYSDASIPASIAVTAMEAMDDAIKGGEEYVNFHKTSREALKFRHREVCKAYLRLVRACRDHAIIVQGPVWTRADER